MRAYIVILITFVSIFACAEPAVAWESYPTGYKDISQWITIAADASGGYSHTFNISDPNNTNLMNYPQNVLPWLNETGYRGSFTGPYMPPALINIYNASPVIAIVQGLTKFNSNQVMSGSSYSWWRIPIEDPDSDAVTLKIWHVQNAGILNWTVANYPYPREINHPTLVFNMTYNMRQVSYENITFHWFNNTDYWGDEHHWGWVRVVAPLHSDEHYAYQWAIGTTPTAFRVYFAMNDIGDDKIYKSWLYSSVEGWIEGMVDIDCSVLHQYGMGYSVSGLEINATDDDVSINFASTTLRAVQYDEYITFMMPFINDVTNTTNVHVSIRDETSHWTNDWWVADDGPTDFTIRSFVWQEAGPGDTFYINMTFQNQTNKLFIYDPASVFESKFEDDSTYATHRLRIFRDPMYPPGTYLYFRPYHALQATEGSWVNTWIDPVFILDGHVIDFWGILENLDVSKFYPFKVRFTDGLTELAIGIYNVFDNLPGPVKAWIKSKLGLSGLPDFSIIDAIARAMGALGSVLYKIGAWMAAFMEIFADNASWVFTMLFHGLNIFIFIPVWFWLVLLVNGIKRWFVICVKDGPVAAVKYGQEFLKNSVKMAHQIPIVRVAERTGSAIKKAI